MPFRTFHSVRLNADLCEGCTHCIRRCPTEAIRVREGRAYIIDQRCIDCGECIRICPHHAKEAVTDPLDAIHQFQYKIALPAPTLYGQFKNVKDARVVLAGLLELGFDDVYEVAYGADIVTAWTRENMERRMKVRPVISSACPAIVRLIQVRFPDLIDNIMPVQAPVEVAARLARRRFAEKFQTDPANIGIFFITPCPAKVTSIHYPLGVDRTEINGAISILDIYGALTDAIKKVDLDRVQHLATSFGVAWANSGGEVKATDFENSLSVEGIHNVVHVLEEIENDKLTDLDFFEGLACPGGCVGGALTFENPYVAKNRIRKLSLQCKQERMTYEEAKQVLDGVDVELTQEIPEVSVMKLDDNMREAMRKMDEMERILRQLPGIDCGSCGAPTCRCLAEDIVRGMANELDCIYKYKERVKALAQDMVNVSNIFEDRRER